MQARHLSRLRVPSIKCFAPIKLASTQLRKMSTTLQQQVERTLAPQLEQQCSVDKKQGLDIKSVTDTYTAKSPDGFKVHTWAGGDDKFWWGLASSQGRRHNMEDAHAVHLCLDNQHTALFGVFDGHAGKEVAAYCATHIRNVVVSRPSFAKGKLGDSLTEAFLAMEEDMKDPGRRHELFRMSRGLPVKDLARHPSTADAAEGYGCQDDEGAYRGPQAGATACVALVRGNQLYVASVGDSRCVLSDSGQAVGLTRDHKAQDPQEKSRVEKAGLFVAMNRVCTDTSSLAMTRALGDTKYKQDQLPPEQQAVTPLPDTTRVAVDTLAGAPAGSGEAQHMGMADFMVLACDGLWDCMTNQQAITFLQVAMEKGLSPQQAAQALTEEALSAHSVTPATRDNITVLVVQFAPMPTKSA